MNEQMNEGGKSSLKHETLTGTIIGCAMKVHSFLGSGYPEAIYERCLLIELKEAGLKSSTQVEKAIEYKGKRIGMRRLDIVVENKIVLELKAVDCLLPGSLNQLLNYLKLFNYEVGLILNFGSSSLQFKRATL